MMPNTYAPPDLGNAGLGECQGCVECSQDSADRRRREPEYGRAPQEVAAVHLAGQQLVDQCVLDNPRLFPPVLIEASPTFPAHASLP